MNGNQIELTYKALAECIARVGESHTPLLLATLALDLLSRLPDAETACEHIHKAERLTHV
ncbi:MAG: hypothetical protein NVS1B6_18410 [Steroidobacteraceae bacterium]